ncbi:unnamed protein product [Spirodela intermedia]|uniref:RRM domain-containing protein n=1 Tax=Spirodela intermedia TaxID=51605 RepID=A0A7I8IPA5_SPIIN|nr:unnamed protein product [Spirodela intermedia]CAA6659322.1 unnamed protein product [Spirodela intermedia]
MTLQSSNDEKSESRLYIGNLDQRITESAILKMFAPFGNIVSEDFLWHTRGPKRGEPRLRLHPEAQLAKARMDGRLACGRPLVVHFANEKYFAETNTMKSAAAAAAAVDRKSVTAGGGGGASSSGQTSRAAMIAAIRSKLKSLEEESAGGKKPRLSENPPIRPMTEVKGLGPSTVFSKDQLLPVAVNCFQL